MSARWLMVFAFEEWNVATPPDALEAAARLGGVHAVEATPKRHSANVLVCHWQDTQGQLALAEDSVLRLDGENEPGVPVLCGARVLQARGAGGGLGCPECEAELARQGLSVVRSQGGTTLGLLNTERMDVLLGKVAPGDYEEVGPTFGELRPPDEGDIWLSPEDLAEIGP